MKQLRNDLALASAGLLMLACWDFSGLDMHVMRALGGSDGFAWRDDWLTRDVLHAGGRWLSGGLLLLIGCVIAAPRTFGLNRPDAIWWLLMTMLCMLLIPLIKHFSLTSCPWSLSDFGGVARHVSHWQVGVKDGGDGRCFSSGHATAAFAFLSGWFVLREQQPRWASLTAGRQWWRWRRALRLV